jgi:hypothetical protein
MILFYCNINKPEEKKMPLEEEQKYTAANHPSRRISDLIEGQYVTQSLTFRGLAVMLIGYLLTWLGYSVESAEITRLVDIISSLVFIVGGIIASKGRIQATQPIKGFMPPPV